MSNLYFALSLTRWPSTSISIVGKKSIEIDRKKERKGRDQRSDSEIEEEDEMGIIKGAFTFMSATVFGIYIAQNYNVPNIKKLSDTALLFAKHIEENYRKPKNKTDDYEDN
ncbi:hypothetical protein G4B88_006589 [Cannabis sativa]|uniref:Uncharacterized protein n=1 Tax=Cannabis sativa TaxID=3483 RepID=A0A7J6H4N8_CANSA|nr:hypothetical protein G4B88_006589 [Cannabis sativa]